MAPVAQHLVHCPMHGAVLSASACICTIDSVVDVVGILRHDGGRHRIPALVFGVWCAHPVDDHGRWRVSHTPSGNAVFAPCGDVDWFVAIRIAETLRCVFGDSVPTPAQAKVLFDGVIAIADGFIRNATDWLS